MKKLKPCPHCGSRAYIGKLDPLIYTMVHCSNPGCGASAFMHIWNERQPFTPKKTSIAQIRRAFRESTKKMEAGDKVEIARVKKQLIDAGIITPTGRLTKHYRTPKDVK